MVEVVRVVVATLNFLAVGQRANHPSRLRRHPATMKAQWAIYRRIEVRVSAWARLALGAGCGLGRAVYKLDHVNSLISELDAAAAACAADLRGYAGPRRGAAATPAARARAPGEALHLGRGAFATARPIVAELMKFETPPTFAAERFLPDAFLRAVYLEPEWARKNAGDLSGTPRVRVCGSRTEVLKLLAKWDRVGSLSLLPEHLSEARFRCGLFAVAKDEKRLRQILNPMPENSRVATSSEYSRKMISAFALCSLIVPADAAVYLSADDLADFYHQFKVSSKRAARNHLKVVFRREELHGLAALEGLEGDSFVPCFQSLGMGDCWAVEFAQAAHETVLGRAGLRKASEVVHPSRPLPRGDYLDVLFIDDHVGIEVCRPGQRPQRLPQVFDTAAAAYAAADVKVSAPKAVRETLGGTVLGARLDGAGWISAPPAKVLLLMTLTLRMLRTSCTKRNLLECILGSWVFVLMFCRPALSVVEEAFRFLADLGPGTEIIRMPLRVRDELLALVTLGPLFFTDLKAPVSEHIYCTDASSTMGGVVRARVAPRVAAELWRVADHRGRHVRLGSALGAYLDELGVGAPAAREEAALAPPRSLGEGYLHDFAEVFVSSDSSNLGASFERRGYRVLRFGLSVGTDLLQPAPRWAVIGLILRGVVRAWHFAPPRTTSLARFSAMALHLIARHGGLGMLEQAGSSAMRHLDIVGRLQDRGFVEARFPLCGYG